MFLNKFKIGWINTFEKRFNALHELVPDLNVITLERYNGMLRSEFNHSDEEVRYILNAVAYKIERESAKICESCGEFGRRTDEGLPEKMCLCWKCHALMISELETINQD